MQDQGELNFHTGDTGGYEEFQRQRYAELDRLARAMGLPVGRYVTIRLRDSRELQGRLLAVEDPSPGKSTKSPKIRLKVDGVSFPASEIEGCIIM